MTHKRKSPRLRRWMARMTPAAVDERNDRRVVVNLFATWHPTRCGRVACHRALACVDPDVACFDENRDHLRDALRDLADSKLLADPDDFDDGADADVDPA